MSPIADQTPLPEDELSFTFVRSSGPGGQNVNKVSTAVQLRFDARNSPSLSDYVKRRLLTLASRWTTKDGVIVISAQRFRSQEQNRRDALDRLCGMIAEAALRPKPRRTTGPTRGSVQRRIESKKRRSLTKGGRRLAQAALSDD
jgi:ribosome-associated protein